MAVSQQTRFASVDARRGITVAAMLLVNNPGDWGHVYAPLLHADWHGCTPTDLVFPVFLCIVGVSVSLGIVPRAEAGVARDVLVRALLWRAAKIVALGLALHLLAYLMLDRAHVRPWGVLQRIGVCFAIVGLVALYAKPRTQWALIGVILFQSAYVAEVVRGGLQAIPKGQYEAAAAMGLGYWRMMGLVILPQAFRMTVPPLISQTLNMWKGTSIATVIGAAEMMYQAGQVESQSFRSFEAFGFASIAYLLVSLVITALASWFQHRYPVRTM